MSLFVVDCEASGPTPRLGVCTEFAAVLLDKPPFKNSFYANAPEADLQVWMGRFEDWILRVGEGRAVMVSDNPAFDWQWINDLFWRGIGRNPLGHSARRIGDFYAGLQRDFRASNRWKHMRDTRHTHNPVDDARGNAEALWKMVQMAKENAK